MPGMYAHYRFGRQVLSSLDPAQKQTVTRFRRLYDMGLYGPDIFEYDNPLMDTAVAALSEKYHGQTGREFFEKALETAASEGEKAYLYGVLAHYCLDSACAGFLRRQQGGSPARIAGETEFDSYLLRIDGLPTGYDRSQHMTLTRGEGVTVSNFYPPVTPAQTYGAIRRMTRFYRFLAGKSKNRVEIVLKFLKKKDWLQRIPAEEVSPEPTRVVSEYILRYNRAVKQYPTLLRQLLSGELGSEFDGAFR